MVNNNTPKIFLSNARPDERVVRDVYNRLSDSGINVWMDTESIPPGAEWEGAIQSALRSATLVLVFLSRNSVTREGFLQKEITAAIEVWKEKPPGKIYLIPVKIEECEIHERLAKFHWVNLFDDVGWQRLLRQIDDSIPEIQKETKKEAATSRLNRRVTDRRRNRNALVSSDEIPFVTFPEEVRRFVLDSISQGDWVKIGDEMQRFVLTLGCKLEPIVQIVPPTPVPLIIGFECLGLGALGENFQQICNRCSAIDPALLRLCLAIVSIRTISSLRLEAIKSGFVGAKNLLFSMNLDPFMLDSLQFKKFLHWYYSDIAHNVIFEVNETTTQQYLPKLKNLQVDFNLRYSADDLNNWHPEVRKALIDRVEMTKMDYRSFIDAMAIRGDDRNETIKKLLAHNLKNKPLIVEGVEESDYLEFLERHWDFTKYGHLYGQGYILGSEVHWSTSIQPLNRYKLPGGSFLLGNALDGTQQ